MSSASSPDPAQWVDRYGDELYRFVAARVEPEQAEELVQETFLSALEALAGFRGEASERTWLFTILRRKLIDFYRRQARSLLEPLPLAEAEEDHYFGPAGHWKAEAAPHAWEPQVQEQALEQEEFQQVLLRCQQQLPPQHAAVFALRFVEERETDDICKELGLTPSNFWVIVHRAKLRLRRCLEMNWFENPHR